MAEDRTGLTDPGAEGGAEAGGQAGDPPRSQPPKGRPPPLFPLFAAADTLPGIGPKAAESLRALDVLRPRDLLLTLPHAGVTRRSVARLADLRPPETATVTVTVGQDETAVAITVRDVGVGLAPTEIGRVFDRFWRADPARARTTGGTGLGLAIALGDTRLHGGWLQVWGRPGAGAQFRLTLPRRAGAELTGSPLPLEPVGSGSGRLAVPVGRADG